MFNDFSHEYDDDGHVLDSCSDAPSFPAVASCHPANLVPLCAENVPLIPAAATHWLSNTSKTASAKLDILQIFIAVAFA